MQLLVLNTVPRQTRIGGGKFLLAPAAFKTSLDFGFVLFRTEY